jgi:hypothetical protein
MNLRPASERDDGDRDKLTDARGCFWGLIIAGGIWLAVMLLVLTYFIATRGY